MAAALLLVGRNAFAASTYVLGSPSGSINTDGWSLDSANMTGFRGAITGGTYFGTSGTVATNITISDQSLINGTSLSSVNGFMVPWWNNTQSSPYQATLLSAFNSGMDLWILADDSSHNGVLTALGITLSIASGTPSNGVAPFFIGPFGTAANTLTSGNFAQFDTNNITSLHGLIGGTNTTGENTIAYWPRNTFSATSGALLVFSDVDMISNFTAQYAPLNPNGILALNSMAWLTSGASAIPEPSTYALFGLGCVVAGLWSRRRGWTARD